MPRRSTPNGDNPERPAPVESAESPEPERSSAIENSAKPTGTTETEGSTVSVESAASAEPGDQAKSAGPPGTTTTELAPAGAQAKPTEPAPTTAPATPTVAAGTGPLQSPGSAAAVDSTTSAHPAGTLVSAGTTEPTGTATEPADTTDSAGTRAPASGAGDPDASAYGSPVAAARFAGSASGTEPDADSTSDAVLWGPGSRAPVQPPSAPSAPEYPRPPAAVPRRNLVAYPAGVLPAAGAAGLVAAATVPLDRPGIGWLLAGSAAAAAVGIVHHRARRGAGPEQGQSRSRERLWWAIAALALPAVGTFRAAGWLFVLCVGAAAVAGSLAVVGRRSERGIFRDALAVPLASAGAVAWVYTALGKRRGGAGTRNRRLGVSAAVTVALLAVFVPLLAGADATFAALIDGVIPRMDGDTLTRWIVVFLAAGIGTLGALYLLAGPPLPADGQQQVANRTLARLEWGLPVGALTAVFALFLGAQLVALFGGDDYVQRTAGLTYAEYARGGFWQLSAVTVLTLAVILPVLHRATRDTAVDRLWLRGLLCAISGLTLVMIASALGRMWTYQQAYGFTVLRLLVGTCEIWLGIGYVLVIIAVLRLETAWLPRSAIATGTAALLALAALNPEGLVAAENIDRWERGEKLDVDYLAGLSVDIVPALDRLPAPIRNDLLDRLDHQLDDDTWNSWNLSRARAR
ncbi:DUF4153 domain-containing protein [Nocardia carnea]|uniref:DUF4153 domain-containing protein n=1 Tax=Nocardia carnea TaxID=37328 RepID=UPI002453CF64|nr:DUF4153 domain-containing protein [Nocardia carnea]